MDFYIDMFVFICFCVYQTCKTHEYTTICSWLVYYSVFEPTYLNLCYSKLYKYSMDIQVSNVDMYKVSVILYISLRLTHLQCFMLLYQNNFPIWDQ